MDLLVYKISFLDQLEHNPYSHASHLQSKVFVSLQFELKNKICRLLRNYVLTFNICYQCYFDVKNTSINVLYVGVISLRNYTVGYKVTHKNWDRI